MFVKIFLKYSEFFFLNSNKVNLFDVSIGQIPKGCEKVST